MQSEYMALRAATLLSFVQLDIVDWTRLLFLAFNTLRIILIMIRQSILTSNIIWFVSKYNKEIYQLQRYPLRRTLLTYWPNLCMVTYSGSINLLHYLLSMTILKFEDPLKFAIATKLVYLYRHWCIYGRTLHNQQRERDISRVFIFESFFSSST